MNLEISEEEIQDLLRAARSTTPQELLTAAWEGIEAGPNSEVLRTALISSASQIPELQSVLNQLTSPEQAVLDFSITGESVIGHSASASEVGNLVKRVSESVKEIAKSVSGLARLSERLLVTAPMPGSVRLVFSVAPESRIPGHLTTARGETEAIETQALSKLIILIDQAEHSSDLLDQSVQFLRQPARDAIKSLAKSIAKNDWNLTGELSLPGGERAPLNLSSTGSDNLLDALEERLVDREIIPLAGFVDGWIWSRRSMMFQPDSGLRFEALVDNPELEDAVALCNSRRHLQVSAEFEVLIVSLSGDSNRKRKSYKLLSISQNPMQPELS